MPRKEHIYKELRETIEELIELDGLANVEHKLRIVVIGVRHTGIEQVWNGRRV